MDQVMKVSRMRKLTLLGLFTLLPFVLASLPDAQTPPYDLLLRNGRIVDGTGSTWYRSDVAVRGDTIVRIAPDITDPATRAIDLHGQVVAPGFIDIHTHARRTIFDLPTAENYVRQGVTTLMEGPDGGSPVPLGPFLAKLDALPKSVNIGSFIGQGSIRSAVIGNVDRRPTADELDKMRAIVEQGMKDGAFGLSSGLFYVPGRFTSTEEVIELSRVASRFRGIYISHMRDEASGVIESVKETISIGEQGGLPAQVTHHKIVGPGNWGRSVETLRMIGEARARGVDATIDQYPYTASSTSIQAALLPAWALEGGREEMLKRLKEPATRAKIKAESARLIRLERGGGDPKNVVIARCEWAPSLAGKTLAEVVGQRGLEPTIDSDGEIPVFGKDHPHPRSYGTFARVLAVYVRERKIITLEDAVRKMTSFPAQRLGLLDRGMLRPGMKADIAIFDPAQVRDAATFERPHQYAKGFSLVVVNGQVVFEREAMTTARPGRVLYKR
jgi:N-acyl-D-amino-acid deacylase